MTISEKEKEVEENVVTAFDRTKAIRRGHFVYNGQGHGEVYVDKKNLYCYPEETHFICSQLAERIHGFCIPIDTIIAPAMGGITLSHEVALWLGKKRKSVVCSVYAQKDALKSLVFEDRSIEFINNKNVFIVDDVVNTGKTVKEMVAEVLRLGGNIIGFTALWNRGGALRSNCNITNNQCFDSLVKKRFDVWDKDNCPLCAQGIPINTEAGKGKQFLAEKNKS